MVLCKFFLEGKCRYGASCRFEHTQSHHQNVYQQNTVNQPRQQYSQHRGDNQHQPINLETLLYVVKEDAINSMEGGQWPFSCYAPLLRRFVKTFTKNSENLPGLIDYSPEEVHWEAVSKSMIGQFQEYIANIQQLANSHTTIQRALQNLDPATANFIVRFERGENVSPVGTVFDRPGELPSVIPSTTSAVSSNFSFKLPAEPSQASNSPSFRFQLPSQQPNPSPFRFQLPTQQTAFSQQVGSTQPPAFGQQIGSTQPLAFSQQTGSNQQAGFAPQPGSGSFKFQLPSSQNLQQSVPNAVVSIQTAFGSNQTSQQTADSTIEKQTLLQLTQSDIEQFKAEKFSFGKIPRIPPPKEFR